MFPNKTLDPQKLAQHFEKHGVRPPGLSMKQAKGSGIVLGMDDASAKLFSQLR